MKCFRPVRTPRKPVFLRQGRHGNVTLGILALLFEVFDLQVQSLNLFPHLPFASLKALHLALAGILG